MLFRYKVNFRPEICTWPLYEDSMRPLYEDSMNKQGVATVKGFVSGVDYGDGANKLVKLYGLDQLVDLAMYECEDPMCDDELPDFENEDW